MRALGRAAMVMALACVPFGAYAESPKQEAQEEIRKAFEEAEKEISSSTDEAKREIGQAGEEALREIEQARQDAKMNGDAPGAVDEAMIEMKDAVREATQEANEAVTEVKTEAQEALVEARNEADEAVEECSEESDNRGGGGALTVQILQLDTDPFIDLNKKEADLRGKQFDFNKKTIAMLGGLGYYDVGNGTRVGVTGAIGYKHYISDIYTTGIIDDTLETTVDSVASLQIWPVYLGFNFEKAFTFSKMTFFVGGMFGGGAHIVYKDFEDRTNPSAFIEVSSDTTRETDYEFGELGAATFMAWDLHGGISFHLAPVFQLGFEPYVLLNYAPEGFGTGFGDFFAVSPGMRIRFTFGKNA